MRSSGHADTLDGGNAPTRDETAKLIEPAIWDVTVQALGDGG
jgi:hypothetical protein